MKKMFFTYQSEMVKRSLYLQIMIVMCQVSTLPIDHETIEVIAILSRKNVGNLDNEFLKIVNLNSQVCKIIICMMIFLAG